VRKVATITSAIVLILILVMMGASCGSPPGGNEVIVGNKNFTEQYIVGQLMKQLLEDRGFVVKLKSGRSSECLRESMEFGDIDICAEYTGTAWMLHLGYNYELEMDNNQLYQKVKEEEEKNGLIWMKPIWNNNTYALASWPEFVEKHGLKSLSDLATLYQEKGGEIKTFVGLEFSSRADGLPALQSHYDFKVAQSCLLVEPVSVPLESLKRHECDVAMVFGTDASIAEHGWYVYVDDKSFFPPYDLTPYVRKEVLDQYPEIEDILNELTATFPGGGEPTTPEIVAECQKVWQELNAKLSIDKMKADEVARDYLIQHGLIKE